MIVPQPVATVATAAVGAAVIILSGASVSNMYQTYALVRHQRQRLHQLPAPPSSTATPAAVAKAKSWTSADEAVQGLSKMKKNELMELFLHCDAPEVSDVACCDGKEEWMYDGYLLENGPILTPVTNFITNRLFGRGRPWLGKAYMTPTSSASGAAGGMGKNRFAHDRQKATVGESLDRTFDYSVGPSSLTSATSTSLFNRYAPHCPAWSPMSLIWRGMVDELRVIPLENGSNRSRGNEVLLLGMGYFSWSCGAWNSAPFCLVARRIPS